jgi:diguanylate cyclase (GGDEF)-like protein
VLRLVAEAEDWSWGRYRSNEASAEAAFGEPSSEERFTIPVASEIGALGTLAFGGGPTRASDERLVQAAVAIGNQVGQFLRRMQAEESLRQSESRFRALTAMSSDFFWETDALHHLLGMAHGSGEPQTADLFLGPEGWAVLREAMDMRRPFRDVELARPQEDGTTRYYAVSGEPQLAADGRFVGYRGVGRDITDIALARERIASLAYSDALTGLDNRSSLAPTLEKAIERTRRRGTKLAGLFVDLDGFKQINDAHGHDAGDRLLIEVGRRLRAGLRSSDPVARLGGDEFFIVLEDLSDAAPAERVAQKVLAALLEPYELGAAARGHLTASIGISLYPDDAGDASTLMKHADTAMYQAKEAGKNAYRLFGRGTAANDPRAEEAGSA